jgi:gamma-glutamylaminecyclotransferase
MRRCVFVYGTLRRGHVNHAVNMGRRLPGTYETGVAYPLYLAGPRRLPWLIDRPGEGLIVRGELYEVDGAGLARMDALERIDEPGWYRRAAIVLRACGGPAGRRVDAEVYFGDPDRWPPQALHAGPIAEFTAALAREHGHAARDADEDASSGAPGG